MLIIRIILIVLFVLGIISLVIINYKIKNSISNYDDIINYFKDNSAINYKNGIKKKELPDFILNDEKLSELIDNNIVIFKRSRYYLNEKKR